MGNNKKSELLKLTYFSSQFEARSYIIRKVHYKEGSL